MVIAHRGDPYRARENTLPSLRAALESGADVLAVDLAFTGDGQIVAIHGPALNRLWGEPRELGGLTMADLAMLSTPDGLRIPTLLEVVVEFAQPAGPPLLLHVPGVKVALAADDIVRSHGMEGRTMYAGGHDAMRAIRARRSAAHLTLTWADRGLPPAELWELVQPGWYNAYHRHLTPDLVSELHRCGYGVLAWMVSDPADMIQVLDLGVDGILTDRPRELAELVRRHRN